MWDAGKRCTVLLCFDFDAESLWISKNLTTPSVMSRGEYGDRVGVPRLLALLEKYSIKATFFVPAETARRHPDTVKAIHQQGHEIGHHGDIHESPVKLAESMRRDGFWSQGSKPWRNSPESDQAGTGRLRGI